MKLLNNLKLIDIRGKIFNTKDVKIKIIQELLNKNHYQTWISIKYIIFYLYPSGLFGRQETVKMTKFISIKMHFVVVYGNRL